MSNNKSQISPIPPEGYGDRFVKFITGITKPREEVEQEQAVSQDEDRAHPDQSRTRLPRTSTDEVIAKAERQAEKSARHEVEPHGRTLSAARSSSAERGEKAGGTILPVLEEIGESGSTGGRSTGGRSTGGRSARSRERDDTRHRESSRNLMMDGTMSPPLGGQPPPTPPKDVILTEKALPSTPVPPFLGSQVHAR